jgi:hypothetical protein
MRQRKLAGLALAKADAAAVGKFDPVTVGFDQEQMRQALQNLGGAVPAENRRRSLDALAVSIPRSEISDALKASAAIANDAQRSHFQKWLLLRLGWVNPMSAMTNASAIEGNIVNDEGTIVSGSYFQLAVLDNWMQSDLSGAFNWVGQLPGGDFRQRALEKIIPSLVADNPTNTLARLNALNPAPDAAIYTTFFQCWAAKDPMAAIQQRQQIPNHDQDDAMLCRILTVWMIQQPSAAVDWVQSQTDSESKHKALETCIRELAKTDVPKALALAQSLPEGEQRNSVMAAIAGQTDSSAELSGANHLDLLPETIAPWPWTKYLLNSDVDSPIQIKPKE